MIALLEVLILIAIVAAVLYFLWPGASSTEAERLHRVLSELRRQRRVFKAALAKPLEEAIAYGLELRKLLPRIAELERLLGREGLEPATIRRLEAHREALRHTYEEGVGFLENFSAELVLWQGPQTPEGLSHLQDLRAALREALNQDSPQ
ncbi:MULTISPECIES: hypothetical protein [unclassified Meiothermus]|uniref:hypothetical protein n=1 Tax=unclassified Meiothermus TaxID=370471 RepID=UPI000D7C4370|nr:MULTISPECIES: hypothetical protein [unclassified Meiothermus]PZA08147.1 hypothetical protein DNA98_03090 [Meiothermus sp. Pnk-1]RYM32302.1 hypothetical protein EWH23_14205 [Meiothermus sp. PNK-Is4]